MNLSDLIDEVFESQNEDKVIIPIISSEIEIESTNENETEQIVCGEPNESQDNEICALSKKEWKKLTRTVDRFEYREMMKPIEQSEVDAIDISFSNDSEENIRNKIKPMCHALRFWVAVKFYNLTNFTYQVFCEKLFGLERTNIKKFIDRPVKKTCKDYGGLSPSEFTKNIVYRAVMKFASNLKELIDEGLIDRVKMEKFLDLNEFSEKDQETIRLRMNNSILATAQESVTVKITDMPILEA